jgi:hypothetical protein
MGLNRFGHSCARLTGANDHQSSCRARRQMGRDNTHWVGDGDCLVK